MELEDKFNGLKAAIEELAYQLDLVCAAEVSLPKWARDANEISVNIRMKGDRQPEHARVLSVFLDYVLADPEISRRTRKEYGLNTEGKLDPSQRRIEFLYPADETDRLIDNLQIFIKTMQQDGPLKQQYRRADQFIEDYANSTKIPGIKSNVEIEKDSQGEITFSIAIHGLNRRVAKIIADELGEENVHLQPSDPRRFNNEEFIGGDSIKIKMNDPNVEKAMDIIKMHVRRLRTGGLGGEGREGSGPSR